MRWTKLIYLVVMVALMLVSDPSEAARKKKAVSGTRPDARKYASLVVHMPSGTVLQQQNADKLRYPASITKLMTLYLTFEAMDSGDLTLNEFLPISARAAGQPSLNIGLRRGQKITVNNAIASLVVRSANDSAVVLAEAVGGSEYKFAQMMTERARDLGMNNTSFKNASGLFHPGQVSTAKDLARLMIAIERDFPQYFNLLAQTKFSHNGRRYNTHNHILANYKGAVAGKTGYVNASGYNLVTTARRGSNEIVAVVLGGKTAKSRDMSMRTLLDKSFAKLNGNSKVKVSANDNDDDAPAPAAAKKAKKKIASVKRTNKAVKQASAKVKKSSSRSSMQFAAQ